MHTNLNTLTEPMKTISKIPSDRDRVKEALRDLRGMGMNARHAWVGLDFDGAQVDLSGVPSREWYGADGSLFGRALPIACPLDLAKYVVGAVERHGLTAVPCPFYDCGLVYVVAAGDDAEASRVRNRWAAEVAALPEALWGVSVEEAFRRKNLALR